MTRRKFLAFCSLLVTLPFTITSSLFATRLPVCPLCERPSGTIEKRIRNTRYCKELDHLNYLVSCVECFEDDTEYFREMWEDYWRNSL